MGNKYNDGNICLFLEQGFSSCCFNGSRCVYPFSKKGCERMFKEKTNLYKPGEENDEILTKSDVFKRLGIKKGMIVADWFIPYYQIDELAMDPSDEINFGIEMIKKKFDESGYEINHMRIYHNFEQLKQVGIYIIGVNCQNIMA